MKEQVKKVLDAIKQFNENSLNLSGFEFVDSADKDMREIVDYLAQIGCDQGIREINLDRCSVTDSAVEHLLRLQNLEEINLDRNDVGTDGLRLLLEGLKNLKKVNVVRTVLDENAKKLPEQYPSVEVIMPTSFMRVSSRSLLSEGHERADQHLAEQSLQIDVEAFNRSQEVQRLRDIQAQIAELQAHYETTKRDVLGKYPVEQRPALEKAITQSVIAGEAASPANPGFFA